MNLERLEEGQTYKNYKELCEVLGEKTKAGKSKKIQLEEWGRYFEFKKNGNKILIDKVYTTPKEKISNRGSRKRPINKLSCSGVYILRDKFNKFYVGSSVNVYKRYMSHSRKTEMSRSKLLQKDSMFVATIIEETKGLMDIDLLRMAEQITIDTMIELDYDVVNVKKAYWNRKIKTNFKTIKVRKDDYQKVVKILLKNNINIY